MMTEKVIDLYEWDQVFLEDVELADEVTSTLAKSLTDKRIIAITELKSGLSIQTNSYVGRIQIGQLQINIHPKIAGFPLYQLMKYAYQLRHLKLFNASAHSLSELTFFDLLIYELVIETEDLLRRGIQKTYIPREDDLSSPRGRIDMKRLAAQGGVTRETLPCMYFQRDENHILNRTVLAGLKLALKMVIDVELKQNIRQLCSTLEETIGGMQLTRTSLKHAHNHVNRLTARYTAVLEIINILYESQGIRFEDEDQSIHLHGYFFDMNAFFETLIGRLLADYGEGFTFKDQYKLHDLFIYTPEFNPKRRRSPTPRPDYALMRDGRVAKLMDAKYRNLWERSLPSDMLYQLAIYAVSGVGNKTATILYPTTDDKPTVQKVDINDPVTSAKMATVVLQPVNLVKVAEFLEGNELELRALIKSIIN